MPNSQTKYCVRFIVDSFILFIVVVCIFLVKKVWTPFERGMFCSEQRLNYPFKEDSISDSILLLLGVSIPVVLILALEFVRVRRENVGKEVRLFGRRLNCWFWASYSSIGVFLFGCSCSQLLTDIAKHSLGELRPYFIAVCKPDWNQTMCARDAHAYVDPIPCTVAADDEDLNDARMSFPSAHASFSAFTMIYSVIYVQSRCRMSGFRLVKPLMQLGCLFLTFYTCLTRLSDYKHHFLDVVAGFSLGLTIAILVAFYVSDLFVEKARPTCLKNGVMLPPQEFTLGTEELGGLRGNHSTVQ